MGRPLAIRRRFPELCRATASCRSLYLCCVRCPFLRYCSAHPPDVPLPMTAPAAQVRPRNIGKMDLTVTIDDGGGPALLTVGQLMAFMKVSDIWRPCKAQGRGPGKTGQRRQRAKG